MICPIRVKQETILTTRTLQNQRVTTQTGTRFQSDPLAQTFFIDDVANPGGIFAIGCIISSNFLKVKFVRKTR